MLLPALILSLILNACASQYQVNDQFASVESPIFSWKSKQFYKESRKCPEDQELGYSEAEAQFKKSRDFFANQLDFETPTQMDRNNIALLLSIVGPGQALADGFSFDAAYAQWPGMFIMGKEFPKPGREMILPDFQRAVQRTKRVRNLLRLICGSEVSQSCDCEIEDRIKTDPKLRAEADFLVQIGYLARAWNERQNEWVETAKSNTVEDYLASHKEDLRFTIEQESVVFSNLRKTY